MAFFKFEADFVDSLRCIPMQVRLKLDTCGIKLKLSHWHHFSHAQRQRLIDLPCDRPTEINTYRQFLLDLIAQNTQDLQSLFIQVEPVWNDSDRIPLEVCQQAESLGISITLHQWIGLSRLQRFALVKLSRSHHENQNFLPALKEFELI
ncbi:hypothetical protein Syn7502_01881 [Synechococcus sp. PCC 7502]|uniref:nitrate reductase associated protein n=1 Tax=Synechococcus sp. PCC 7502 TaxID=1173263 RepID=UPI00029FE638|nr:nitrate reductase associated protein [Synechococcus sp. PCC 7502]AFY73914.1 hypothetical protein Syn7502_01881 [Synechococcus sp. PCC 7502]